LRRVLVIGGTGAIGFACAHRLLAAGWEVEVTGRDRRRLAPELEAGGARFTALERSDRAGLADLVGGGADLLVDCVCNTAGQADDLAAVLGSVGSAVMISTKAVYVDDGGRHSNSDEAPRFAGPIAESQPTVAPDRGARPTREGYAAGKVAAERVLLESGHPVSVLRPSKIHGPWSRRPREWAFVKRALDRRPAVVLAHRGAGGDHPTAAANIAALVETVAARPGTRVLNVADPDTPDALEIVRTIARHLGHSWREVLLDGGPAGLVGRTPWDRVPPVALDTAAATRLGYRPAGTYAETVAAEIDWLAREHRAGAAGRGIPRADDPFFASFLDYAAEDSFLSSR
jgi:nucleoside-diphosphate-sugar epimerase